MYYEVISDYITTGGKRTSIVEFVDRKKEAVWLKELYEEDDSEFKKIIPDFACLENVTIEKVSFWSFKYIFGAMIGFAIVYLANVFSQM